MTEAEVTKDFAAVLEKVRQGTEIVIEEGYQTVAVISPVKGPGRPIDECIALAKERASGATLDEDLAKDLEEIIAERKPLDTAAWGLILDSSVVGSRWNSRPRLAVAGPAPIAQSKVELGPGSDAQKSAPKTNRQLPYDLSVTSIFPAEPSHFRNSRGRGTQFP